MSHEVNTTNAEEVLYYLEKWEGTIGSAQLRYLWNKKDHDGISLLLAQMRKQEFDEEYTPNLDNYKEAHPKSPIKLNRGFNLDGVPF